jgi:hypothetical protein
MVVLIDTHVVDIDISFRWLIQKSQQSNQSSFPFCKRVISVKSYLTRCIQQRL